jgi:hypothetical protein
MKSLLTSVWFWLAILIVTVLLGVMLMASETIQPRDLTVTRINITEQRIRLYWKTNQKLPAQLSELPNLSDRDNSVLDGWGNPIQYQTTPPSSVTLTSFGANGPPGSTNQNIIVTFDARN